MNAKLFLNAMGDIEDTYIICAQRRLNHAPAKVLSIKRIFTVALAAVLVLLCTVAAAMAISPEFREAVISLFQIGEAERVPDIPAGANEVKQVTIGGKVSAQYVRLDSSWGIDSLFSHCDVMPDGSLENERFYVLEDDGLAQVDVDAPETTIRLNYRDTDVEIRFRAFPYDGQLYLYDVATDLEDLTLLAIYPKRLGSRTDVVVLDCEYYDGQAEGHWAWVYDLEAGEVRDVLAGCGLEALGHARPILFTEDLRYALVRAGDDTAEGTPYLVNLEQKSYSPLGELMGLDISETFGAYEAAFYGSDAVMLAMAPLWRIEPSSVWVYHIPSGTVTPTVVDEEGLQIVDQGPDYAWNLVQKVDKDGIVTIVDLHTGGRVKLEGITAQGNCYLKANASQTKLLWVDWGDDGLHRLGVIDLETGEFTAFEREGMELRYNEAVFWLDDDRVAAMMDLHTGEPYGSYSTNEYYLCVYKF